MVRYQVQYTYIFIHICLYIGQPMWAKCMGTWLQFYHLISLHAVIGRETSQITKFTGPTWGPSGRCRPQMGPMGPLWNLLSGMTRCETSSVDIAGYILWVQPTKSLLFTNIFIDEVFCGFNSCVRWLECGKGLGIRSCTCYCCGVEWDHWKFMRLANLNDRDCTG